MITKIKTFNNCRGEMKFITDNKVKEQFISINKKNVIRGIHCSPYGKTIICLKGSVIDYIIDINNLTYEKYFLVENSKLYIPANKGHLFISLEDNTSILYQLEGNYNKEKDIEYHYRDPFINLDIKWDIEYIISSKDLNNKFTKPIDYIVLGSNGFLGSYTSKLLKKKNKNFLELTTRLEDSDRLFKQLNIFKPKYVICAAGISGKPTVQWCENNKFETYFVNYVLQKRIANMCEKLNIHLTIYGSGLIYKDNGKYDEKSTPNYNDLFYSKMRILLEKDLNYKNILYLRVLYPISGDGHEKCFLSKIKSRLNTTHNIKINCTVLPSLLPKMFEMIETNKTGIYNFVNSNLISIPEILELLKINNYTVTKTVNIITELDTKKIEEDVGKIENINIALQNLI